MAVNLQGRGRSPEAKEDGFIAWQQHACMHLISFIIMYTHAGKTIRPHIAKHYTIAVHAVLVYSFANGCSINEVYGLCSAIEHRQPCTPKHVHVPIGCTLDHLSGCTPRPIVLYVWQFSVASALQSTVLITVLVYRPQNTYIIIATRPR